MTAIEMASYQLRVDEGFRALAYKDTKGLLTIGYGRCLDTHPLKGAELEHIGHDCRERPITTQQAEYLLQNEVAHVDRKLHELLPNLYTTLDKTRQSALINLAYNMGLKGLLGFKKTLALLEAGKYEQASVELLDSQWRRDVGKYRSKRISEMIKLGDGYVDNL